MSAKSRATTRGITPPRVTAPLLTLNEAAEILRLHPRTVREYVRRGELKGRVIGGRYRFRREDLDAFVEKAPSSWEFYQNPDGEE